MSTRCEKLLNKNMVSGGFDAHPKHGYTGNDEVDGK